MRTIEIEKLEIGTIFTIGGVTYKKGSMHNGGNVPNSVGCIPKYGGQWQSELIEYLPTKTEVSIKAD